MIAAIAAVLFAVVALLVQTGRTTSFDLHVIGTVQGWENPALTRIMEAFSWIGSTWVVTVIVACLLVFLALVLRHRSELALLIAVIVGAAAGNRLLKIWFLRDRPDIYRLAEETGYSFPSGHSMAAFALYGVLIYLLWKHIPSVFGRSLLIAVGTVFILMIGVSRIYLGVHYPSDIIGGYLASMAWLALLIGIYRRLTS